MNMGRLTSDEGADIIPKPLVMGPYVYHWTFWSGVLVDVVHTPRFSQFILLKDDGSEIVFKDEEYAYPEDEKIAAGHEVTFVGLGDRSKGTACYVCGLVDVTSTQIRELSGWRSQINWETAREYFGWRTRGEAKNGVLAYYTALYEVLFRVCYGSLGAMFEEEVVPLAKAHVKKWKFSFF